MEEILNTNSAFRDLIKTHTNLSQIWGFRYNYEFLSHMYPVEVTAYGVVYPSVENAYQAIMTLDMKWREKIRRATPQEAKRLSRQMPVKEDKDRVKIPVMKVLDTRKFRNHPKLLQRLLDTGDGVLIEGNLWHDNFWGDCGCSKCKNIRGLNMAGKILMEIRDGLMVK
jgi:ribA/ribD-fused uncharacterized protein